MKDEEIRAMFTCLQKTLLTILLIFAAVFCPNTGKAEQGEDILTLEKAIQEALSNNTLIREAIENQRASLEAQKSARADLFPKLSVSYSYTHLNDAPYSRTGPTKVYVGKNDNFSWDLTLTQPVFTGFALVTKQKIAALGINLRKIEKEQAILDIAKQVKVTYFQILLARKFLEVAREEVNQLKAHVRDAKHFYDQGMISYNDLLKSQVALANARQKQVRAASNLEMAIATLNTLLKRNINQKTRIEDAPVLPHEINGLPELFKQALRNRPELRQLEIALKEADLRIQMAKSGDYPQVALVGQYEQAGDDPLATNNDFSNNHNLSVGVQLSWTFFEWGKTRSEVQKTIYQKRALQEKIEGIKDSILLEVKNAFQNVQVAKENIFTAKEAISQAKENLRITSLQYQHQMTTSTEVLDARTYLTQAEVNYYSALYGYWVARAELKRAVGEK
jgi:outer membrane protein TolC